MQDTSLNQKIQQFYDQSTPLWLDTWGEHMHHGYYGPDGKAVKEHKQAQVDLIEALLIWGNVEATRRILDAGCGVGGSSRHLARRFQAEVLGLTLSPVQVKAAERYTQTAGLTEHVRFELRDMMTLQADDGPFDLIWSLESAEHIADKQGLFNKFHQLLIPEGRLLMVTWCHREPATGLSKQEQALLEKLYSSFNLPPMASLGQLESLARQAGFHHIHTDDWSEAVAPFWNAVIRSALEIRNLRLLLRTGWATVKGAWAMRYMRRGYEQGLIRYGVLQAVR